MTATTITPKVSRRDFVNLAWVTLGGLAVLELGGVTLAYMQPRLAEGEFGSTLNVGKVDDFPPGSVTHISNGRFYLSRLADGGFLALYQRCTHLGCNVPWDQAAGAFVCPCHNSQFTPDGSVLNPPAPRPLDLFTVTIENGEIKVDTGQPHTRQAYDASQVVYP
ncbi:MAG TPA: Rieske 2Fe-2S domain-containing protein [Anaerolineales bacterium]|nr:Rieske 2Fe-2S domain-containing protein [Anaerolineales bacterium]